MWKTPKKRSNPRRCLSYLVKKEQITKAQASALLKEIEAPKPIQHEEIELNVPQEKVYDTDDLTSIGDELREPAPAPEPRRESKPKASRSSESRRG